MTWLLRLIFGRRRRLPPQIEVDWSKFTPTDIEINGFKPLI